MADRLRLRRQTHAPRELDETEQLYANASGEIKQVAPDGTESSLGSGGNGGSGPVAMVSVPITSAEILALDATPKVLLAAAGGRKYHIVHGIVLHYRFDTAPYSGDFTPAYGFGDTIADIMPTAPIDFYGPGATVYPLPNDPKVGDTDSEPAEGFLRYLDDAYLYMIGPSVPQVVWSMWGSDRIEDKAVSLGNFPVVPISNAVVAASLDQGSVTYTAQTPGAAGNSITITLDGSAANVPTTTSAAVGNAITVTLATDGGGSVIATTDDVVAAIAADPDSDTLVAAVADSSTTASPMPSTALMNGSDGGAAGTITARVFYTTIDGAP